MQAKLLIMAAGPRGLRQDETLAISPRQVQTAGLAQDDARAGRGMAFWSINLLAAVQGLWMVFDGIHLLRHGNYFGPETPGPWAALVARAGFDPFGIGPVFLALGALWLAAMLGHLAAAWTAPLVVMAVLSLWYLPVGTVISAAVLGLVFLQRAA